jgi:hypothetical protein
MAAGDRIVPLALARLTLGLPWSGQPLSRSKSALFPPMVLSRAWVILNTLLFKIEHLGLNPAAPSVVPLEKWNLGFPCIKMGSSAEPGMRGIHG